MTALKPDNAAACHGKGMMMPDFTADKGVTAGIRGEIPEIASTAAAKTDFPDDRIRRSHETNLAMETPAQIRGEIPGREGGGQQAATKITFTGNVRESAAFRQGVVDAAGGLIKICVGGNQADILPDEPADQLAFIGVIRQ